MLSLRFREITSLLHQLADLHICAWTICARTIYDTCISYREMGFLVHPALPLRMFGKHYQGCHRLPLSSWNRRIVKVRKEGYPDCWEIFVLLMQITSYQ